MSLKAEAISGCANFETGKVAIGKELFDSVADAEADTDVDCS